MNDIFYSILSGINIVIGLLMIRLLFTKITHAWPIICKIGFVVAAVGLIGQAIYVIAGFDLQGPVRDQLWVLKDVGMWIFTIGLINQWINKSLK